MARGDARLLMSAASPARFRSIGSNAARSPRCLPAVGLRWAIEGESPARATYGYGLGFVPYTALFAATCAGAW